MPRFLVSIPTIPDWEPVEVDTLAEAASTVIEFDEWGCEVTAINPEPGTPACFTCEVAEIVSDNTFRECWEARGGTMGFLERFNQQTWTERSFYSFNRDENSTLNHAQQGLGR